jgi:hypothetical protein
VRGRGGGEEEEEEGGACGMKPHGKGMVISERARLRVACVTSEKKKRGKKGEKKHPF